MIARIAKYPIQGELGRGGMGRVYRAFDPDVNRPVAIKVLEAETDPELLRRFRAEIDTTGSLQHNNIVTLYECGVESGVPYLVMELLPGETLEAIIRSGAPLTLLDKVRIMNQVALGLAYAHAKGVIHRDVKPGNIMLLPDRSIKIMDFGIARVATRKTAMTQEGFILGTVPYMAPEQFEPGGTADQQTDIFAYGDVYYELISGKHPFAIANELYPTIRRIQTYEPESLSQSAPDCPETLELLVHRAIAKDRDIRYPAFADLLLDNEAILVDLERETAVRMLSLVRPLIDGGNIEGAESQLAQVLELDPGNREARELRRSIRQKISDERSVRRLESMLKESEDQLEKRQFAEAVETLENALRLKPHEPEIERRLAEAKERLSAHVDANRLVAEARKYQQKAALPDALERLQSALQLDPQHTDARRLIPRVQAELDKRQEERTNRALEKARALLDRKSYQEALAALPDPETGAAAERVAELRREIEQQQADHEKQVRAERFQHAVSTLRESLRNNDLPKATEQLEFLEARFTDQPTAAEVLPQLRKQLDEQTRTAAIAAEMNRAAQWADAGDLLKALYILDQALLRFGDSPDLVSARFETKERHDAQRRAESIVTVLEQVIALREASKLKEALALLEDHRKRIGDDPAFMVLREELRLQLERQQYNAGFQDLVDKVQNLLANQRFEDAVAALETARKYQGESQFIALLASARSSAEFDREQRAVKVALEQAARMEQSGDRETAFDILNKARRSYPDNLALLDASEALRARLDAERREKRIEDHRHAIDASIAAEDWSEARNTIQLARAEFPTEPVLAAYPEKLDQAYSAAVERLAQQVRQKLAANQVNDAADQMNRTATLYAGDSRWADLQKEVADRRTYEAKLARVAEARAKGDTQRAEALLTELLRRQPLDDRAARMLAEVQFDVGLKEAQSLRQAHRLAEAEQRVTQLLRQTTDARAVELLKEVRAARLSEAEAAMAAGKFDLAIQMLQSMEEGAPSDWLARIQKARESAFEQKRRSEVARISAIVADLLNQDKPDQARSQLAVGQKSYPGEKAWVEIEAGIRTRETILRKIWEADREYRAGNFAAAAAMLETLHPMEARDAKTIAELAAAVAEAKSREARKQALEWALHRLNELKRGNDSHKLLAFLERMRLEFPAEFQQEYEQTVQQLQPQTLPAAAEVREQPQAPPPSSVVRKLSLAVAAIVVAAATGGVYWWKSHPAVIPPAPKPLFATRRVVTDPRNVAITWNNKDCTVPCTLSLPKGTHSLTVRSEGYEPFTSDVVIGDPELGTVDDVKVSLRRIPPPPPGPPPNVGGTLEIAVDQDDAMVLVDGKVIGMAKRGKPVVATFDAGPHRIHSQKQNYTTAEKQVKLSPRQTERVSLTLSPLPGRFSLSGVTPDTQVAVDGQPRGKTSLSGSLIVDPINAGKHKIRFTRDQYEPREESVEVAPNQTVAVTGIELKKLPPSRAELARREYPSVSRQDPDRLEEFARKFEGTPESADALRIAQNLREQARRPPPGEKPANDKPREPAPPDPNVAERRRVEAKLTADRAAIMEVLERFRGAYGRKDLDTVRALWPAIPGRTLDTIRKAFRTYRSIAVNLQPVAPVTVTQDTGTVTCRRTVTSVGGPNNPSDIIMFHLQRTTSGWIITNIE